MATYGKIKLVGLTFNDLDQKVSKIKLYYSREWRSWGVLKYNKHGDQIGEGVWVITKEQALKIKKELEKEYGVGRKK